MQINEKFLRVARAISWLADDGTTDAAIVTTGQLSLAQGGTHADLSGTGGTSQVLKQTAAGADVTVARLASSDLSDASSIPVLTPVLGDTIYANSTPAWTKLAGNTTIAKEFFTQTGNATISAAPAWFDLFGTSNTFSVSQTISASLDGALDMDVTNTSAGTSANIQFKGTNDTSNTGALRVHGSGRTATRYGVTLAKIVEILAAGSSLGLLLGSTDNVPIVFGTNSVEVARFTPAGRWTIARGMTWPLESASTNPYTVVGTGVVIGVTFVGACTVNLPATPAVGDIYVVTDPRGQAAANNITVAGNGSNINGAATSVINVNYSSLRVYYTGSIWNTW